MKMIEDHFNARFTRWGIALPPEDIANQRRGKIVKAGWAIWYLFGTDGKGEYLDYYASHRMTDDDHIRIYADGQEEQLPVIETWCRCSQDPEENKRLEQNYFAENQRVAKMLQEKGFDISGDEPGSIQINRILHLNKIPPPSA